MNINEVKTRAITVGIERTGRMKKAELIRLIQRQEGNNDCYGSENRMECQEIGCCWRADCLTKNAR